MMSGSPPSQLISRRPLVSGPGLLPLLGSPSAARIGIDCALNRGSGWPGRLEYSRRDEATAVALCVCTLANWTSVDSRPKAAMIELVTDCVVFIGLFDLVLLSFWFSARLFFRAGSIC